MPEVSIIMGAYNAEKHISNALLSLENQTYKNFDVIIINDGSTDNTEIEIEKFIKRSKLNIIYLAQSCNKGLASSLNTAIKLAKGRYIARMDADDICRPDRLEKSIIFTKENGYDFITTKAECYKDGIKLKTIPRLLPRCSNNIYSTKILRFGNIFIHGTFFGKKFVFEDIEYDENYKTAQDYDFLCRLSISKKYKMGFLNQVTYESRIEENSLGRKKGSRQFENAKKIAKKHFNTDRYVIPSHGLKRLLLLPLKYLTFKNLSTPRN